MAGLITDLTIAARLAGRKFSGANASKISSLDDTSAFRAQMDKLLANIAPGHIQETHWLTLAANAPPWVDSGMNVNPGESISWFICGRSTISKALDLWTDPRTQVWAKVGNDGEIISATRQSHTLENISDSGKLMFGNYFPNDWADRQGALQQDPSVYEILKDGFLILVIRWASTAQDDLNALLAEGDYEGILAGELERLTQGPQTPDGWQHLWHIGETEIYHRGTSPSGEPCIHCQTRGDVGILQKDVSLNLTPTTHLSWDWLVSQLPSTLREDSVPSHDYLSIAVEFDNGRDISYQWSHSLPVNNGYHCPLPNWKDKEYHIVVRSGYKDLNQWLSESRNVFDDYQRYIGTPPTKIVRVWLIANSVFQRRGGDCSYAKISLHNDHESIDVL